jgi:glucose-6-phosphate isomerase
MNLREPVLCSIDLGAASMSGMTGRYEKRMSDLAGLYADETAWRAAVEATDNAVVYDVSEFRPSADAGDLIFGITRMGPGKVGREFFLTRGHIHARADRPEVYYAQRGRGVMLMESPDGETRVVEMGAQAICYVPPFWIHRSVNIGADDFVMMFSYPADAGQDYGIIERAGGMRHRVVADEGGGWMLVENAGYIPRDAAVVAAILAAGAPA